MESKRASEGERLELNLIAGDGVAVASLWCAAAHPTVFNTDLKFAFFLEYITRFCVIAIQRNVKSFNFFCLNFIQFFF